MAELLVLPWRRRFVFVFVFVFVFGFVFVFVLWCGTAPGLSWVCIRWRIRLPSWRGGA